MIKGLAPDMENGELFVTRNQGYSFCNCRNIFFTDWKNINQGTYDEMYHFKYQCEDAENLAKEEVTKICKVLNEHSLPRETALEIGAVHDYVMDNLTEKGMVCDGLDICKHSSKYPIKLGDFETTVIDKQYDFIWASHVFEHFKDPIAALDKIKSIMKPGGSAYIAMPDTFFIDWEPNKVHFWDWAVTEHHILWGMDNFVELCEERGFKCLWKERNTDLFKKKNKEWFWKKDFKAVLCLR